MIPSKDPLLIIAALRRENNKLLCGWRKDLSDATEDGRSGNAGEARELVQWGEGYEAALGDLKKGLK